MGKNEYPQLSLDRAHERQGELDDAFDAAVAAEAREQAASLAEKARAGNTEVLDDLAEDTAHKLGQSGVLQQMIRVGLVLGDAAAGLLIMDLVRKAIDDAAEVAALQVVEKRK